jgi:Beta-propeller repeat
MIPIAGENGEKNMNDRTVRPVSTATTFMTVAGALLSAQAAPAQEQLWIRQFGTNRSEETSGLVDDGAGGVFITGWTTGGLAGPNGGDPDAFLARYDQAGNQAWIRQFGTVDNDLSQAIATDGAGGVFVSGDTNGDLGAPNVGNYDAFLARYNGAGNRLWITQFGTGPGESVGALVADGAGGVIVVGWTSGSLGGMNAGLQDAFLARYDSLSNQMWIRQFGTSGDEGGQALASAGAGGVMVAGTTKGSLAGPQQGFGDAYVARFDGLGNQIWIQQFGTNSFDEAHAIAPDGSGGVVVAGYTRGGLGGLNAGLQDAFLARFDSAGNQLWIRQFGTSGDDYIQSLTSDGAGGVLVAGGTSGSLCGPFLGGVDVFLARYDGAGNQLWMHQFGTTSEEWATCVSSDGSGDVTISGHTRGDLGGPNAGPTDAFLARFADHYCMADCDPSTGTGVLDIFDFLCFQSSFVNGEPYACDCDTTTGSLVCDIFDFLCFQGAFVGGCN